MNFFFTVFSGSSNEDKNLTPDTIMRSKFGMGSRPDVEKGPQVDNTLAYDSNSNENYDNVSDGAVPGESFEYGNSLYAKLQRIAGKFNIEQRGIERVPENERTDTSYVNIGSMVG